MLQERTHKEQAPVVLMLIGKWTDLSVLVGRSVPTKKTKMIHVELVTVFSSLIKSRYAFTVEFSDAFLDLLCDCATEKTLWQCRCFCSAPPC
jgi:hypothetical protein